MSNTQLWITGVAQGVTALVAVAALIVSIISLRLQRRDKRPQLKITGSLSAFMDASFQPIGYVYNFKAANNGQMSTTVTQIYLWYQPNLKMAFPEIQGDKPLPCKLEPGEGANWWVNYEALREVLRRQGHKGKARVKLEASDATGGSYTTRTKIILNAPWWRRWFGG